MGTDATPPPVGAHSRWRAQLAVVATYVYFLLFAQFGFLELMRRDGAGPETIRAVMAAMGISGLLVSILAACLLRRWSHRRLLLIGWVGAAGAATAAPFCSNPPAWMGAAVFVGSSTALSTVALATGLREMLGSRHFGRQVGFATAVAYLVCNIPPLFHAPPQVQAGVAAAFCLLATVTLAPRGPSTTAPCRPCAAEASAYTRPGFIAVLLSFLALVWLDSAAFAVIQASPSLAHATWGTGQRTLFIGGVHFVAAAVSGWLLDRGALRRLLPATFLLFAVAFTLLDRHIATGAAGVLYACGISAYSVALVYYPSRRPDQPGEWPARWRAGLLFGLSGWLGSALGVGMAQNLGGIPPWFLLASGALVLGCACAYPHRRRTSALRAYGVTLGLSLLGLLLYLPSLRHAQPPPAAGDRRVALGRRVYIREGCMNCHSQYIRPRTMDQETWGPARPLDREERPPLAGNRRQGPDLANVGNRRHPEWQRLHLASPTLLSPGSRMPAYDYLFEDARGEHLVAYLASLGASSLSERFAAVQRYPQRPLPVGDPEAGRALFVAHCAACHGAGGRGDGPLADRLSIRPTDLAAGVFRTVSDHATPARRDAALARVVKHGLMGTPMAGHEYWSEQRVSDVVDYLHALREEHRGEKAL